jgi:hypothetical protein
MPSTRNKTLRSTRNGSQSGSEEPPEPLQNRNLRSAKDDEPKTKRSNKIDFESVKDSVAQKTESVTATTAGEENGSRASSGNNNNKKSSSKIASKAASWEDEVFDFLTNNQTGMLDEDEVVSRMNRMVRAATQQFDSAKSIMNTVVNDGLLFDSCREEAQNQAVIDDLLKEIFGALTTLDRHAISWIKRTVGASGRRQKSKHGLLLANTKRRLTRGMAKTSIATKNEDILYNAVREIEREKNITSRREWRLSSTSYNADDEGNRSKADRHKRRTNGEHSVRHYCLVRIKSNACLTLRFHRRHPRTNESDTRNNLSVLLVPSESPFLILLHLS